MTSSTSKSLEERQENLRRWIPANEQNDASKGVNHIAVFSKDLEATAAFYSDVLGMPVVQVTSNRDVEESTHMNVSIGGGVRLSFFDFPHVPRLQEPPPEGVGGVMHIAIGMTADQKSDAIRSFTEHTVDFREIAGSLYFKDPNGLTIELMPLE